MISLSQCTPESRRHATIKMKKTAMRNRIQRLSARLLMCGCNCIMAVAYGCKSVNCKAKSKRNGFIHGKGCYNRYRFCYIGGIPWD